MMHSADYVMCACCLHIKRRDAPHERHSMGVVPAECPANRGWTDIRLDDWAMRENWRLFVAILTARYATCPDCGASIRAMRSGKLITHTRALRPSDGRKRKPPECEGSRALVLDPLPAEAAPGSPFPSTEAA
jgi:hypothetical protein